MSTISQLQALEAAYNQGSANRRNGSQYPYTPTPAPVAPPSPRTPIPLPSDNGMMRQAPSIPSSIPSNLPKGIPDSIAGQKVPTPTQQYSPLSLPNPQIPLGNKLSGLGDKIDSGLSKAGNAAALASSALAVGSSLANAAQKRDANSLANAAITTASGALLLAPNPYAKAAGFALGLIGAPLANLIFPSKNNAVPLQNLPISGGQTIGVAYNLFLTYDVLVNGVFGYHVERNGAFALTAPVRSISAPYQDGSSQAVLIADGAGTRQIILVSGSGSITINGFSPIIERVDGLPDNNGYQPLVNNDGRLSSPPFDFDPSAIGDALKGLNDKLDGLSDDNKALLGALQGLGKPSASNPSAATPQAPTKAPSPAIAPPNSGIAPSASPSPSKSGSAPRNGSIAPTPQINDKLAPNAVPQAPVAPPSKDLNDQAKKLAEEQAAKDAAKAEPKTNPDRFKDPKDCKFSCSALAECFSDVKVKIFDGCNPENGTAKTKEITVQALPKNKANVIATFAELLEIRSRECSLADKVVTTPEYWLTRVGQRPQAVILYRTFENGKFTDGYFQLQIPHYNGGKNAKPSLPSYQKGECMAIYTCLDGSTMQVYASTDAEALRVINACEKYINPRMRMKDKKGIKTGKRAVDVKALVKPIRLDFSSVGQARLSPDWSIPL